jgi:hypothetical protein
MFTQGQKIVCVDDEFNDFAKARYTHLPVKDHVYLVRSVMLGCNYKGEAGEVAIYLEGLVNPANLKGVEYGFNCERFAPLQSDLIEVHEEEYAYV